MVLLILRAHCCGSSKQERARRNTETPLHCLASSTLPHLMASSFDCLLESFATSRGGVHQRARAAEQIGLAGIASREVKASAFCESLVEKRSMGVAERGHSAGARFRRQV